MTAPRERALMHVLNDVAPDWRTKAIHESSPIERGVSVRLRNECQAYTQTQFYPGVTLGVVHDGFRCEDLERQTFDDAVFDIVITLDVFEHLFDPAAAHREIWRTLRDGGVHIFTTPVAGSMPTSSRLADRSEDGSVTYLVPPSYHENPVSDGKSLVTFLYGYDIADMIVEAAPFDVEIRRFNSKGLGIIGAFTEVIIARKVRATPATI